MKATKHFYFKFNTKDFRTDHNVCNCEPASIGVYTFLLCLLFDSPEKGRFHLKPGCLKNFPVFLLKQNVQQTNEQFVQQTNEHKKNICCEIAAQLAKHLPFANETLSPALQDLLENNVIYIDGESLCQKRMLRDYIISKKRTVSGANGGNKTKNKVKELEEALKIAQDELHILLKQNVEQTGQQKDQQFRNYNYNYNNTLSIEEDLSKNCIVDTREKKNKEVVEEKKEESGSNLKTVERKIVTANFKTPTLNEVIEYFYTLGKTDENGKKEAERFFNHHEGLGWMKGITPIQNWRSFANMWASSQSSNGHQKTNEPAESTQDKKYTLPKFGM